MAKTTCNAGRSVAIDAITKAVRDFPYIYDVRPKTVDLSDADARLAHAIVDIVLRRWLTLERLIEQRLTKKLKRNLRPRPKATLLCGAAQLIFMKLPDYAVVDDSVAVFYRHKPTAGMINAVLRQVADLPGDMDADAVWEPDPRRLPMMPGALELTEPALPPIKQPTHYLSIVTSHPRELVDRWRERFGDDRARYLCLHSLKSAPTVVTGPGTDTIDAMLAMPHDRAGSAVWLGDRDALIAWLAGDARRRVQDVTPSRAIDALRNAGITPETVVDFCAGRGTKTKALAEAFVGDGATVYAGDPDGDRFATLVDTANAIEGVKVFFPEQVHHLKGQADLLVLDVPCSNSGVLARRIEAKYRLDDETLAELVELQREIVDEALPLLKDGGVLLYTTCSIEPEENEDQLRWLTAERDLDVINADATLPSGEGSSYRDGGYWALLRKG